MKSEEGLAAEEGHEAQCKSLIAALQQIKEPLNAARAKKQQEKAKIEAAAKEKAKAVRDEIVKLHEACLPVDELMSSINTARNMKGDAAAETFKILQQKAEALING